MNCEERNESRHLGAWRERTCAVEYGSKCSLLGARLSLQWRHLPQIFVVEGLGRQTPVLWRVAEVWDLAELASCYTLEVVVS